MIINRIYEHQNLLSLWLVSFLVGLRTYQHPCNWSVDEGVDSIVVFMKEAQVLGRAFLYLFV